MNARGKWTPTRRANLAVTVIVLCLTYPTCLTLSLRAGESPTELPEAAPMMLAAAGAQATLWAMLALRRRGKFAEQLGLGLAGGAVFTLVYTIGFASLQDYSENQLFAYPLAAFTAMLLWETAHVAALAACAGGCRWERVDDVRAGATWPSRKAARRLAVLAIPLLVLYVAALLPRADRAGLAPRQVTFAAGLFICFAPMLAGAIAAVAATHCRPALGWLVGLAIVGSAFGVGYGTALALNRQHHFELEPLHGGGAMALYAGLVSVSLMALRLAGWRIAQRTPTRQTQPNAAHTEPPTPPGV